MPLAFILSACGCLCFALAIERHWRDVFGPRPYASRTRLFLRGIGAVLVGGSLAVCLDGLPASLGVLVWAGETMAGAGCVAAFLALTRRSPALPR